jgi:DNA polymerase-3 subunit delta
MRYLSVEAFEKHVEEALPHHPSSLYTLLLADPFERRWLVDSILSPLKKECLSWNVERYLASEYTVYSFIEELSSETLLSSKRILIYDEIEKIKKGEWSLLFHSLQSLSSGTLVILSGTSVSEPHFYDTLKKEIILLDLSSEKPWDRKERLRRWLLDKVRRQGKMLSTADLAPLLERRGWNFAFLLQEIDKLITYVGEKKSIDQQDIERLCRGELSAVEWKLSEAIIWGGNISPLTLDPSSFHLLMGQLRYQLHVGLIIATSLETRQEAKIQEVYPKLRPASLHRYKTLSKKFTSLYFLRGLHDLFDLELNSRIGGGSPSLLLDIFMAKLHKRRSHASLSSS